ncbi:hypothetical protein P378_10530 [Desulforamulus profundi]|uniref:Uncharacterized protein n=1 Tax=Desulforamulus profundi TaxID=1383067 RepID=A0A2C6MAM3_9FIRM|nr:hypothetical protein P378_10530 [Desulforamulus profundi]
MELVISPTGICINLQNIVDRTFPGVVSLMLQDISLAFLLSYMNWVEGTIVIKQQKWYDLL